MKEKGGTTVCFIAQQEEIGACWTFSKITCTNIVEGRNLSHSNTVFFQVKKKKLTATEASCYEVEKSITAGNCISANKQFSSILEDPLKQVVCSSSSSDSSDESSSDEFDSKLVV